MPAFRNPHFRLAKHDRLELKELGVRVTSKMFKTVRGGGRVKREGE